MSENGRRLIDGNGAQRVLSTINQVTNPALRMKTLSLRPASRHDAKLIWQWANDSVVRSHSFDSTCISIDDHMGWFREKLISDRAIIYILEMGNTPVAQIRYECAENNCAEIAFSVAAEYRGLGLGTQAILLSAEKASRALNVERLKAAVLVENKASLRAFEKAGFRRVGREKKYGKSCHIFLRESAGQIAKVSP